MANDELYTPKHIFDALKVIFDLDVCAPVGGPLHVPAVEYFDEQSDGLTAKWFGCVWMNPPFSGPKHWVAKWLEHKNGIMIAPLSKSNWFMDLWNSEAAVINNPVRFRFVKPDGSKYSIAFPTAIWAIGESNITALKMSGLGVIR